MPKFLDLNLDDQQQRFLLQSWMYSEPPALLSEPNDAALAHLRHSYERVVECDPSALTVVCSAGTQIQFAIPNLVNDISSGGWAFTDFYGLATAIAAPVCVSDTPAPLLSDEEPESASIENERVITFRPSQQDIRLAIHSANVRLSPDAIRFVAKARGRRLRFEEDPETQSE